MHRCRGDVPGFIGRKIERRSSDVFRCTEAQGMINADPYLYPLVISDIIFIAVVIDSSLTTILERLERRKMRIEPD